MEMQNVYHGHLIISRLDDKGWSHELYRLTNPKRDGCRWVWESKGPLLATFEVLSQAIAEAKRLCPPETLPVVENLTIELENK